MLDAGDRACVMEVSSHALSLGRADCIDFDVAAFTNLTQDHLDFHADMEDYFAAKRLLFVPGDGGAAPAAAVVNVDDPYGQRLAADVGRLGGTELTTFSAAGHLADLTAHDVGFDAAGASFTLHGAGAAPRGPAAPSRPLQRRERPRRARVGTRRGRRHRRRRRRRSPPPIRSRGGWSRSTPARTSA